MAHLNAENYSYKDTTGTSRKWSDEYPYFTEFTNLFEINSTKELSQAIAQVANDFGFERYIFRLLPNKQSTINKAFLITNHPSKWLDIYNEHQYHSIDPTIRHCYLNHFPLFWAQNIYSSSKQKTMYRRGKKYGLCSGLVFPIHGPNGEFGMMNFASENYSSEQMENQDNISNPLLSMSIPLLSIFVDYVFELSKRFTKKHACSHIILTPKEKEVIHWYLEGKTSWEISKILSCSESTINFHLANIRQKFNASNTQLAVVRALRCGLIQL